jgi:hypothetical protein
MKNKFTLGAISGISALALAIPILAQVSSAQVSDNGQPPSATASPHDFKRSRGPLTQADVQQLIDYDTKLLANVDAIVAIQKNATQERLVALTAAAAITDDAQRQAAVQAAMEAFRANMESAISAWTRGATADPACSPEIQHKSSA